MSEWRRGWRTVLGCAVGSGVGAVLLFFTFSLFVLPIAKEFDATRGEIATVQSLIIAGALGAPLIGRATDILGFRRVFLCSTVAVVALECAVAFLVNDVRGLAVCIFLIGLIGVGTTGLTVTRPINAWFDEHRGLALGLSACGIAIATIIVPPPLEALAAAYGWRAGLAALAALGAIVGLPAVYFLVRNEPPEAQRQPDRLGTRQTGDWSFLREGTFWLMACSLIAMGAAGSGFIGQMSPMIQDEGLSAQMAAFALSMFAIGQVSGRLIGGWFLTGSIRAVLRSCSTSCRPAGFFALGLDNLGATALAAAFLIGFQQGSEHDIFAYFTARRFGISNYGTVYGALIGLGWIGNATGLIGVGRLHDVFGNYMFAQLLGASALAFGALLFVSIRLPPRQPAVAG
ncbi:MAG: MFS transporter [Sphingomonadales bacterium]|nr:MFS transporter [Sphingomonadales bacterium]